MGKGLTGILLLTIQFSGFRRRSLWTVVLRSVFTRGAATSIALVLQSEEFLQRCSVHELSAK